MDNVSLHKFQCKFQCTKLLPLLVNTQTHFWAFDWTVNFLPPSMSPPACWSIINAHTQNWIWIFMGPLQVHSTGHKSLLCIHLDLSILGFQIPYTLARIEPNFWKVNLPLQNYTLFGQFWSQIYSLSPTLDRSQVSQIQPNTKMSSAYNGKRSTYRLPLPRNCGMH